MEPIDKIKIREMLPGILAKVKGKIVTTNGCYDLLHPGHVHTFMKAKSLGTLIVGVNSDASIRRYKGIYRPLMNENDRAFMVASLSCVDYVTIFDEDDPRELLKVIKPDFHVKSKSGYKGIEREVVEQNGVVVLIDDITGYSTSTMINRAVKAYLEELKNEVD